MGDKIEMFYHDGRNRKVTREIRTEVDAKDFRGTPFYPWLIIAANPHLTVMEVWLWLWHEQKAGLDGVMRSRSWIQRKRWMMRPPGATSAVGRKPNSDGNDERAVAIIRANPSLSARGLVRLLAEHDIKRGKDWVWMNRV